MSEPVSQTTMVDRVARAIFEGHNDCHVIEGNRPFPERHFEVCINTYRYMAREAIYAMENENPDPIPYPLRP